jgi:hypothetical protein
MNINVGNLEQITYANVTIEVTTTPDGNMALLIFQPAIQPGSHPTKMITIPMSREYAKQLANRLTAPSVATFQTLNGAAGAAGGHAAIA